MIISSSVKRQTKYVTMADVQRQFISCRLLVSFHAIIVVVVNIHTVKAVIC